MFKDASDRRLDSSRSFLHIMPGNLTAWEMSQIKAIDNLIQKCQLRCFAFEREHHLLNTDRFTMSEERVSQRLRYFATDLYSVLDYLCYLCYCHYKNNGNPSYSKEARNVKFPCKELKTSDVPEMKDSCENKTRKFVWEYFNTIFNYTFRLPNEIGPLDEVTQQLFNDFEKFIKIFQVMTKVDGQENPVPQNQQPEQSKNFNTLHYLRNTTVHRNLIDIAVERAWLYVNLQDGSHEVSVKMPERNADPQNWQSIEVSRGCWITLPSVGSNGLERPKILLPVLDNLLSFVKDTVHNLLRIAFSDQIPDYHHDTVQTSLSDGVQIHPDGDRTNTVSYSWKEFQEKCGINENNSYLFAV